MFNKPTSEVIVGEAGAVKDPAEAAVILETAAGEDSTADVTGALLVR